MRDISYYTSIIIISWLSLVVLSILVWENNRLTRKEKTLFYLTYALVALAALMEWMGILFNGDTAIPTWLLRTVKCADYILTPIAGAALMTNISRQCADGHLNRKTVYAYRSYQRRQD